MVHGSDKTLTDSQVIKLSPFNSAKASIYCDPILAEAYLQYLLPEVLHWENNSSYQSYERFQHINEAKLSFSIVLTP